MEFANITTEKAISIYSSTRDIFQGLLGEIRELSKKKPDATLSMGKVKIINRVLKDIKEILDIEPEGKFLDLLEDEKLPQTSDAVLVMVQFETALNAFKKRYYVLVKNVYNKSEYAWVTREYVERYREKNGGG